MKIAAIALLALGLVASSPTFAVDNSISPLCRSTDSAYQRPGGFCDAVASRGSQGVSGGTRCPVETSWDNAAVACLPET